jgi:hypothetical protein
MFLLYSIAGLTAMIVMKYKEVLASDAVASLMRPIDSTWVSIGPTLQIGIGYDERCRLCRECRSNKELGIRIVHGNRTITVECSLPHSEKVTFTMYDISGHEIASLGNLQLESGVHLLPLDIRNVATGCYIVRMQTAFKSLSTLLQIMR